VTSFKLNKIITSSPEIHFLPAVSFIMADNTDTTPRLLRLSISLYRNPKITGEEGHDFARNNHAVKAAPMHANHGMQSYVQVSRFLALFTSPRFYQFYLEDSLILIADGCIVLHPNQLPQGPRRNE